MSLGRILNDETFDSRAATYDRENRFFDQDFEELRAAKYLILPVPEKFGGTGLSLAEMCREQRCLAYHAPATALAVNMHLYWVGVAADLWRRGDTSLDAVVIGAGRSSQQESRDAGLLPLLHRVEDCRKPVVMAIHGGGWSVSARTWRADFHGSRGWPSHCGFHAAMR